MVRVRRRPPPHSLLPDSRLEGCGDTLGISVNLLSRPPEADLFLALT